VKLICAINDVGWGKCLSTNSRLPRGQAFRELQELAHSLGQGADGFAFAIA
jgi:hypothetical protein